MNDECRGNCRVMTAVSNDPEMGNVEMTFREALEMYVSRTHNLEFALASERKRVAELDFARESLWNHYRRCTDALGLRFDEVPENPKKELEMWRELRAKVAELEADRERLVYEELTKLANWVRSGDNINRDAARDDIARGIENRLRQIDAAREAVKG